MTVTLRKCLHCSGTGWDSPPRPDRRKCRECGGDGELPDDHPWAGYSASYDFCAGPVKCPVPRKGDRR